MSPVVGHNAVPGHAEMKDCTAGWGFGSLTCCGFHRINTGVVGEPGGCCQGSGDLESR